MSHSFHLINQFSQQTAKICLVFFELCSFKNDKKDYQKSFIRQTNKSIESEEREKAASCYAHIVLNFNVVTRDSMNFSIGFSQQQVCILSTQCEMITSWSTFHV